jgi:uncharacterized protein
LPQASGDRQGEHGKCNDQLEQWADHAFTAAATTAQCPVSGVRRPWPSLANSESLDNYTDTPHSAAWLSASSGAAANLAKHGITFEMARDAFNDPHAVDRIDDRENYGEERCTITGMVESRLLFVVYTETMDGDDEVIRIISARKATRHEKRTYEG